MLSKSAQALVEAFQRGFRVSKCGNVVTSPNDKLIKTNKDRSGYENFTVKPRGYNPATRVYVHRLQAYQTYGDEMFRSGLEVRHLDGNKTNNSAENIAVGSHSDNIRDIPQHIRNRVAKNAASKLRSLSDYEAESLRRERDAGYTYKELCAKYGISKSTVSYIVNKKTYR